MKFKNLIEILRYRSDEEGHNLAFSFLQENGTKVDVNYALLDNIAKAIACKLQNIAKPKDRVLLLYKPGVQYIMAFWGCVFAGLIPVPIYLPNIAGIEKNLIRIKHIIDDAEAKVMLCETKELKMLESLGNQNVKWITTDDFSLNEGEFWKSSNLSDRDIAFLQYTSGSTSSPKGVMLSHSNLINNLCHISKSFQMKKKSKGIIWLPPYHDMGLIGGILAPIYAGFPVILMSPITFIKNPLYWLKVISENSGTISGGPNFAYDLCVKRMLEKPNTSLDLSSWDVAFCGAEPIQSQTIEAFISTFSNYGFRPKAFHSCYGLAENTLMVTSSLLSKSKAIKIINFDAELLKKNKIRESLPEEGFPQKIVSCGSVISEHEIKIVDPILLSILPHNQVGEIFIKGPSVAEGYWKKDIETKAIFQNKIRGLEDQPSWLRTGDLGFIYNKELFITGRIKELIIIRGQNFYPQDIETASEKTSSALKPFSSSAFTINTNGYEELVLVHELFKKTNTLDFEDLVKIIRRTISERFGLHINKLIFVNQGSIPKTTSGKTQRILCKEYYLAQKLPIIFSTEGGRSKVKPDVLSKTATNTAISALIKIMSAILRLEENQIELSDRLMDLGIDSIQMIEIDNKIYRQYNVRLDFGFYSNNPTIEECASAINKGIQDSAKSDGEFLFNNDAIFESSLELNPIQESIYYSEKLGRFGNFFNISRAYFISGDFEITCFAQAITTLIAKNSNLRSTFFEESTPRQKIHEALLPGTINIDRTRHLDKEIVLETIKKLSQKRFNLTKDPLIKFYFFECSANEWILLFMAHHIIVDFLSIMVFFKELFQLYQDIKNKKEIEKQPSFRYNLPALYSEWYNQYLKSSNYYDDLAFWTKSLNGFASFNFPENKKQKKNVQSFEFILNQECKHNVEMYSKKQHVTSYITLLSIFQILIAGWTEQNDIVIGSPFSIKEWPDADKFMGYCVNILPIRVKINKEQSFTQFIEGNKKLLQLIHQHKRLPFGHLIQNMPVKRRQNKLPIIQIMFVYQPGHLSSHEDFALLGMNSEDIHMKLHDIQVKTIELPSVDVQTELTITILPNSQGYYCNFEYDADIFDESAIVLLAQQYQNLISEILVSNAIDEHLNFPMIPLSSYKQYNQKMPMHVTSLKTLFHKTDWDQFEKNIGKSKPEEFFLAIFSEVLLYWSQNKFMFLASIFSEDVSEVLEKFYVFYANDSVNSISSRIKAIQKQMSRQFELTLSDGKGIKQKKFLYRKHLLIEYIPVIFNYLLNIEPKLYEKKDWFPLNLDNAYPTPWINNKIYKENNEIIIEWLYIKELFPENLIEDMYSVYCDLLKNTIETPIILNSKKINFIPCNQKKSRELINQTAVSFPEKVRRLEHLFYAAAFLYPKKIALISKEISFTYQDLFCRANQLARCIKQNGLTANDLVAIVMEKGWEQIVSCLAILISGCAYLPIDATLPVARMGNLLDVSGSQFILTQDKYLNKVQSLKQLNSNKMILTVNNDEENEFRKFSSDALNLHKKETDLAYVIYTSGSTGNPKGVMIEHKAVVNTILDINNRFAINNEDKVLGLSSLSFDLSVYDIFGIFAVGGTLILPQENEIKEPKKLLDLLNFHQITIWNSVPMFMQIMTEYILGGVNFAEYIGSLKLFLLSGDWIPIDLPEKIKKIFDNQPNKNEKMKIVSLGGATECSIWSIYHEIKEILPGWKSIPYGTPLANQQFYILNERLESCPDWVQGKVYIGGIGLARGYWNEPELTFEKFIIHPDTKERLYCTGDLGVFHPDGVIEFIGRTDYQVKIGGYRVELEEIQKNLIKHPAIKDAIVVNKTDGIKNRLIAYIISTEKIENNQANENVREKLNEYLLLSMPSYMIPSIFVFLEQFPLNSNGKLDRNLLPDPSIVVLKEKRQPVTSNEVLLKKIFEDIMGIENIGIEDNFFEIGGNSLMAVKLSNSISKSFSIRLDTLSIFEYQTIYSLSKYISDLKVSSGSLPMMKLPRVLS